MSDELDDDALSDDEQALLDEMPEGVPECS